MCQKILDALEPNDAIDQSYLPFEKRSFRMKVATIFYIMFRKYL